MDLSITIPLFPPIPCHLSDTSLILKLSGLDILSARSPTQAAMNLFTIYQFIWGQNGKPFVFHSDLADTYIIGQMREADLSSTALNRDRYTIYSQSETDLLDTSLLESERLNNFQSKIHSLLTNPTLSTQLSDSTTTKNQAKFRALEHFSCFSMLLKEQHDTLQSSVGSLLQHHCALRFEMSYHLVLTYLRSITSHIVPNMTRDDWYFIVSPLTWQQKHFSQLFQHQMQSSTKLSHLMTGRPQQSTLNPSNPSLNPQNEHKLPISMGNDLSIKNSYLNQQRPAHKTQFIHQHQKQQRLSNDRQNSISAHNLVHKSSKPSPSKDQQQALQQQSSSTTSLSFSLSMIQLSQPSSHMLFRTPFPISPDQSYARTIHQQLLSFFSTYFQNFGLNLASALDQLIQINQLHRSKIKSPLELIDHVFSQGIQLPSQRMLSFLHHHSISNPRLRSVTASSNILNPSMSSKSDNSSSNVKKGRFWESQQSKAVQSQAGQLQRLFVFQQIIMNAITVYTYTDSLVVLGVFRP